MRIFSLCAIALVGCGEAVPADCDAYISAGGDDQTEIQRAFVEAGDGDTVCLGPGTFVLTDAVEVSALTNFTLRGSGRSITILDFSMQTTGGDGITMMNMVDVNVADLSIRDAPGDGLVISSSDGVYVQGVAVGWSTVGVTENGKYGIYPVSSRNVRIESSITFGASDAGFYMGQVTNCIINNNEAWGNVAAYEVENSINCEVTNNVAHDNVGGFLVMELPSAPARGAGTLLAYNESIENNLYNFAEDGTSVELIPRGTGVFIIGGNDVEVRDNRIEGNDGLGVGVISWGTAQAIAPGETPPDYDPWAEDIYIHDNTFTDNGNDPGGDGSDDDDPLWLINAFLVSAGVDTSMGVEDILWDGLLHMDNTADTLCIQDNGAATFRNLDILDLLSGATTIDTNTDLTPHDCAGTPRPPVTLE